MPAVFIHGVPETHHVWQPILAHLHRPDTLALTLPGFATPRPPGFQATKEDYVTWIIQQIEQQPLPVDLVGHDWGCLFTARVASLRPDLVRTWAAGSGPVSSDYEWHPLAKIWQTLTTGEQWMADHDIDGFTQLLQNNGVPAEDAPEMAAHIDGTMKDSILRLYRSARTVGSEWEPDLAGITAPGLVFWGLQDDSCPVRFADSLAAATKARRTLKLDTGHWTTLTRPQEIAQALRQHWDAA